MSSRIVLELMRGRIAMALLPSDGSPPPAAPPGLGGAMRDMSVSRSRSSGTECICKWSYEGAIIVAYCRVWWRYLSALVWLISPLASAFE